MLNEKEHKINIQLNPDNIDSPASEKYRTILTNNLRKVFRQYIQKRDEYACQITGAKRNVSIYNFFLECPVLEFDERNHHVLLNRIGEGHLNHSSLEYTEYMISVYGWEVLTNMLRTLATGSRILKISQILDYTRIYTEKLKELGDITRWPK